MRKVTSEPPASPAALSRRELAAVRGIADGQTYREIANHLGVAAWAVREGVA